MGIDDPSIFKLLQICYYWCTHKMNKVASCDIVMFVNIVMMKSDRGFLFLTADIFLCNVCVRTKQTCQDKDDYLYAKSVCLCSFSLNSAYCCLNLLTVKLIT